MSQTNISQTVPVLDHLTNHLINEMNGVLGHLCAHIGQTGSGETPDDDEMNEMTLPSRHRIRNSSPGGLMPNMLPLRHRGSQQL